MISPAELRPLFERARTIKRATPEQATHWLRDVRRFATPAQKGRARFGAPDDHPLALYDRVDAKFANFVRFKAPHTRALLNSASSMLGPVLRDTGDVLSWLQMKERVDSVVRRGLLVALGALGVTVHPEHVLFDPNSPDDAAAWVLSAILADVEAAPERVAVARDLIHGAARRVISTALTRLRIGYSFSAIG